MANPPPTGTPGRYGYDWEGNLITDQTPIQRTLAHILGAEQAGGGEGGGGGNTTIVGATPNGNTTSTTSAPTGGPNTIAAGAISIEFILSNDFTGTINGVSFDNTGTNAVGVYRLDAPPWKPLASLTFTITAGTVILTTQT